MSQFLLLGVGTVNAYFVDGARVASDGSVRVTSSGGIRTVSKVITWFVGMSMMFMGSPNASAQTLYEIIGLTAGTCSATDWIEIQEDGGGAASSKKCQAYTLPASCLDYDGDGTCEVYTDGASVSLDPDDGGAGAPLLIVHSSGIPTAQVSGVNLFSFGGGASIYSPNASGWVLTRDAASLTAPNIRLSRGDINTGLGADGSDTISLVAGGQNVLQADYSASSNNVTISAAAGQLTDVLTIKDSSGAEVMAFDPETPALTISDAGNTMEIREDAILGPDIWTIYRGLTARMTFTGTEVESDIRHRFQGALNLDDPGTRPTCDSTTRGYLWFDEGGAGVADSFALCAKDSGDAYDWRVIY